MRSVERSYYGSRHDRDKNAGVLMVVNAKPTMPIEPGEGTRMVSCTCHLVLEGEMRAYRCTKCKCQGHTCSQLRLCRETCCVQGQKAVPQGNQDRDGALMDINEVDDEGTDNSEKMNDKSDSGNDSGDKDPPGPFNSSFLADPSERRLHWF